MAAALRPELLGDGTGIALIENRGIRVSFLRRLKVPASESQLALTLAVSLVFMAAMLFCLLWQANIIAFQQEVIRSLWDLKNAS
jgi:hypothetical protein